MRPDSTNTSPAECMSCRALACRGCYREPTSTRPMSGHQRILGRALVEAVQPLLALEGIVDGRLGHRWAGVVVFEKWTRETGADHVDLAGAEHDVAADSRLKDPRRGSGVFS